MTEMDEYTAQEIQEKLGGITYSALRNLVKTGKVLSFIPPGSRQARYKISNETSNKLAVSGYTAKEAQEILGMTYSALRNQVTAGHVRDFVPTGKRQAQYIKEDVDQLKHDMDSWLLSRSQTQGESARFVKATIDDMHEAVALADAVFGGHNTISIKKRIEWISKNPDIDYFVKQENQLLGYLSLVPLRQETIKDLLTQKRYAKELVANDILNYEPGVPVDIYGMAIAVRPGFNLNKKRDIGRLLIMGAQNVLAELGSRGIIIRSIQAHSSKPDGIRLMRHAGFTETTANVPGLRDFVIDVETSGIPLLKRYKDALKQWQN